MLTTASESFEIIDDFLPPEVFSMLRRHCDGLSFEGVRNPVDGVVYPGISTDIPPVVRRCFGKDVKTLFMRLSLAGVPVPHQAHTDTLMGKVSLMLYLTRAEFCCGGTSLVVHTDTGMFTDPETKEAERIWTRDTNNPMAWAAYEMAEMKPNRAAMFDARLMHRAEPIGGFGTDARNGRLVLTAFY